MTREEKAIKALKWFKAYNEEDYCGGDRIQDEHGDWYYRITEQDFEAFDTAIKVLEKESTTAVWSNYDKDDITQRAWHDVQTCSKCGMGGKHYDEFRYCPNCGRIMTNAKGWGNRWK